MSRRTGKTKGDGLLRDARSPYWQIDKEYAGARLRRSARTTSYDEAKAQVDAWVAEQRKRVTLEALGVAPPPADDAAELTLDAAATRYFEEVGARTKASEQEDARLAWICANFESAGEGSRTKLSAITENMILALAARRRAAGHLGAVKQWTPCSEHTINRMLDMLRAMMRRAAVTWKANVAVIDWRGIYTPRAKEGLAGREMPASKEAEAFAAMRVDVREPAEFLLIHGIRSGRALMHMEWPHVDFDAGAHGVAKVLRKTKLPGEHYYEIPLTARSREILLAQRGRHPKLVWTYVVHRRHTVGKRAYRAGDRRPLTKSVMRGQVGRALREVLGRFRIHDLRHTTARRTLRASKDLRAVQGVLGHADIATTAIYTPVLLESVHAALEAAESRRNPGADPAAPAQVTTPKEKTGT